MCVLWRWWLDRTCCVVLCARGSKGRDASLLSLPSSALLLPCEQQTATLSPTRPHTQKSNPLDLSVLEIAPVPVALCSCGVCLPHLHNAKGGAGRGSSSPWGLLPLPHPQHDARHRQALRRVRAARLFAVHVPGLRARLLRGPPLRARSVLGSDGHDGNDGNDDHRRRINNNHVPSVLQARLSRRARDSR